MSEVEQNRTGLYVSVTTHTENLGGRDPEDRWSADSYSHSNYMNRHAAIVADEDRNTYRWRSGDMIVVGAEVKPGDTVYVLWAEYSTGDTFHSESGCYEVIAGFVSEELAEKNAQQARLRRLDQNYSGWNMDIELDDGTMFGYFIPWLGYFERLEQVHVDSVIVVADEHED